MNHLATTFATASTRLESDGVHWLGTFANIVKTTLDDLATEAPIDVIVRRDFGADDRMVFVPVTVETVDGSTIRGTHQDTGDEVAIDVNTVTGLAF